ncbi:MAG TPA: hypothetical protein VI258_02930 [Rhodanobacteraceae bacterium]
MTSSRKTLLLAGTLAFASGVTGASAQGAGTPPPHDMGKMEMHKMEMGNMPSMHTMPATVSSVDAKTGIVEVDSAGMALKVHFPPASVADLKAGDKITLHMGFSK